MSNQEILTKAINQAIAGGWLDGEAALNQLQTIPEWALGGQTSFVMSVIFNHDFAKALWGDDEDFVYTDDGTDVMPVDTSQAAQQVKWKYHLQQMVLAEDPLIYLRDHI